MNCYYCGEKTRTLWKGNPCCWKCYIIEAHPEGNKAGEALYNECDRHAQENGTDPIDEFIVYESTKREE